MTWPGQRIVQLFNRLHHLISLVNSLHPLLFLATHQRFAHNDLLQLSVIHYRLVFALNQLFQPPCLAILSLEVCFSRSTEVSRRSEI